MSATAGDCIDLRAGAILLHHSVEAEEMRVNSEVCPFCLSGATFIKTDEQGLRYVECAICGARGPLSGNTDDAINHWNIASTRKNESKTEQK